MKEAGAAAPAFPIPSYTRYAIAAVAKRHEALGLSLRARV
jgi:hypothetical protein